MASIAAAEQITAEWSVARAVQRGFMRHSNPIADVIDIHGQCCQVGELGGDFYDFVPLPNGRLAIAIGDASGKGLPAALMSSNVQSSLRTAALFTNGDGAKAIEAVNRQVYLSSLAERYATLFYAIFDPQTRTLRYVNAGHPPAAILRRDGSILWLEEGGAPVGMFEDFSYEEGIVQMNPGEVMIACSDGILENTNARGQEWGVDLFLDAAADASGRCAEQIVGAIFSSMYEFSERRQTDDATALALRVH